MVREDLILDMDLIWTKLDTLHCSYYTFLNLVILNSCNISYGHFYSLIKVINMIILNNS